MAKVTDRGLVPPDDPIFSEGLRIYGKPSLPSTKTSPGATAGDVPASPPRKATPMPLSGPPKREDFHSQEKFEEARRCWQAYVGRLPGLIEQAARVLGSPPKVRYTAQGKKKPIARPKSR